MHIPYEIYHKILLTSCLLSFPEEIAKRGPYETTYEEVKFGDNEYFKMFLINESVLNKFSLRIRRGIEIMNLFNSCEDLEHALEMNNIDCSNIKTEKEMIQILQQL